MKTKVKKFDEGSIEYRIPIYTDLLKLYSKLDANTLAILGDDKSPEAAKLGAIGDALSAINHLVVSAKLKGCKDTEEAMYDMRLLSPMAEIFQDIMSMVSQSNEGQKKRKK